jgi:hypothetical protein
VHKDSQSKHFAHTLLKIGTHKKVKKGKTFLKWSEKQRFTILKHKRAKTKK